MIKVMTAGESHGKVLVAIIEGIPAKIPIKKDYINNQLARRQHGYGRGGRMEIEKDEVEILSGIRGGITIGSPIGLVINNKDYKNWEKEMSIEEVEVEVEKISKPRPGHADLAGVLKTGQDDIRNILERSSARETAARVASASICRKMLEEVGVKVVSAVTSVGQVISDKLINPSKVKDIDNDPLRMIDIKASKEAVKQIDKSGKDGDTLGGTFQVIAFNAIAGIGDYASWDKRIDGLLARSLVSIPGIKGVSFGKGFDLSELNGSKAHDEIYFDKGFYRKTNRAGGIEGGMTNGEPVVINAAMKPIPTLQKPLRTVDIKTKREEKAFKERSDVTAVPSASVIAESMVCIVLANAYLEKFGSDNIDDIKESINNYSKRLQ